MAKLKRKLSIKTILLNLVDKASSNPEKRREEWVVTSSKVRELRQYLKDFLTPKGNDGELSLGGCSDDSFKTRYYFYVKKEGHNECPYVACNHWIDNPSWCNCQRLIGFQAWKDLGWDPEKIADVVGMDAMKVKRIEELAIIKVGDALRRIYEESQKE